MIIVIAEKPSMAREIKNMISEVEGIKWVGGDDYFKSGKYIISWFFGYLLRSLYPEEIDEKYKKWKFEDLPIYENNLRYKYKKVKNGTESQGKLLAKLSKDCDLIINACDPDREGEGIFRTGYNFEKINKKEVTNV